KINFHKLRMLSETEGDIHADISFSQNRVEELKESKEKLKELLQGVKAEGKSVEITSFLEVKPVEEKEMVNSVAVNKTL
ncbi:MAG: hypothetical protein R3345_11200, partial [Fulvivirga sp.]|nr:hypothetical protein [Fulvivirga sp.]